MIGHVKEHLRGVSPVVGTILMVAIVVILAGAAMLFFTDIGDNIGGYSSAAVDVDRTTDGDYIVTVSTMGSSDTLVAQCDDTEVEITNVGQTVVPGTDCDEFVVISVNGNDTRVISITDPEDMTVIDVSGGEDGDSHDAAYYEENADIIVDASGNGDYESVEEGVNNAEAGYLVFVRSGTYNEPNTTSIVNNEVELVGESQDEVRVVSGESSIIAIESDDVTVKHITIDGDDRAGYRGIWVRSSVTGATISNVVVENTETYGIEVRGDAEVIDSTVRDLGHSGYSYSSGLYVNDGTVVAEGLTSTNNSRYGVFARDASDVTITNSRIYGNAGPEESNVPQVSADNNVDMTLDDIYWGDGNEPIYGYDYRYSIVSSYCEDLECSSTLETSQPVVSLNSDTRYASILNAVDYAEPSEMEFEVTGPYESRVDEVIDVDGVYITGTDDARITATSTSPIDIRAENVTLEGVTIDGSDKDAYRGIWVRSSATGTTISNVVVENTETYGIDVRGEAEVVDSTVRDLGHSGYSFSSGLYVNGGTVVAEGLTSINNRRYGVFARDAGDVTITDSRIYGNAGPEESNVPQVSADNNVDMTLDGNYWGSADEPIYGYDYRYSIMDSYCEDSDCLSVQSTGRPVVNTDTGIGYASIQNAMDYTNSAATFEVNDGYTGVMDEVIDVEGVTVSGTSNPVISSEANVPIDINADNVTIDGLTVDGDERSAYRGIMVRSSVTGATISNVVVENTNAYGIEVRGDAEVVDSTVRNLGHSGYSYSSGLYVNGGSVTGDNLDLVNNDNYGLFVRDGSATIQNSKLTGNAEIYDEEQVYSNVAIDIRYNWWGTSDGPASDDYAGHENIEVDPYCTTSDCSSTSE